MAKKIYEDAPELQNLANSIKERYYLYLGHVDLQTIYFAEIVGEPTKTAKTIEVTANTKEHVRKQLAEAKKPSDYCIAVWADLWEAASPSLREWLMFSALLTIHKEGGGKLNKPDVVEHGCVLHYFQIEGITPYWRKGEVDLPSLLSGEPLAIPLPPDPDKDSNGSTLGDDEDDE